LIILDHDRFSRDLKEALLKINILEDKYGLQVRSVDEPLDLDTKAPEVLA
jgi:site-specific DNA recombinase